MKGRKGDVVEVKAAEGVELEAYICIAVNDEQEVQVMVEGDTATLLTLLARLESNMFKQLNMGDLSKEDRIEVAKGIHETVISDLEENEDFE